MDELLNNFQQFANVGSELLLKNHDKSDDIKNKLDDMKIAIDNLDNAYKLRKDNLEKELDQQSVLSETTTADVIESLEDDVSTSMVQNYTINSPTLSGENNLEKQVEEVKTEPIERICVLRDTTTVDVIESLEDDVSTSMIQNYTINSPTLSGENNLEKQVEEVKTEPIEMNTESVSSIISIKSVQDWKEIEVLNWLKSKEISSKIIEAITPCDGALLNELNQILKRVPEFFYSNLRSESNANFKDLAVFSFELRALFSS
jgi:hypothetical protein